MIFFDEQTTGEDDDLIETVAMKMSSLCIGFQSITEGCYGYDEEGSSIT